MEKNGDNQYTLSARSGVAQSTLSRIVTGSHKDPRSFIVKKLAAVYGVAESQLRGETPIQDEGNVIMLNSKTKKINDIAFKLEAMSEDDIDRFCGIIDIFGSDNTKK